MVLACWQINLRLAEIWHLNKKYGVNNQSESVHDFDFVLGKMLLNKSVATGLRILSLKSSGWLNCKSHGIHSYVPFTVMLYCIFSSEWNYLEKQLLKLKITVQVASFPHNLPCTGSTSGTS